MKLFNHSGLRGLPCLAGGIFPRLQGWGLFPCLHFSLPPESFFFIYASFFFLHCYTCLAVQSPAGAMRGCVADALRPRHPRGRLGCHLFTC